MGLRKSILSWHIYVACSKRSTQMITTLAICTSTWSPWNLSRWLCSWWRNGLVRWYLFSANTYLLKTNALLQYDGATSVNCPPSTPMFDPISRKSSLRPCHPEPDVPSNTVSASGDLAHISQIILNMASIACVSSKPPMTPTRPRMSSSTSIRSPTWNTPSKLTRFLKYAETNLGVENACSHEEDLRMLGFGPDILRLVNDGVLKDVGFTPGDVIRLKQNSQQWWNSADAKCKWNSLMPPQSTPPNKRVTFEKRYHGGGSYRLYGPKITEAEGDLPPNTDFDWHYFCKARNAMVPLPFGYVPVLDGENDL